MALAYLLDPCLQHQNRAGVNNVNGYFEVFEYDTDDRATVYTDFAGTLAPSHIGIDNNGRCVMIVDSNIAYRVEMHAPNGDLIYNQAPVWTMSSGGGVGALVKVVSTDGTIDVQKTTVGAVTTYDLSTGGDEEPSTWGSKTCTASAVSGNNEWAELAFASSEGSISYNNGWTVTKKCAIDISASIEMTSGDAAGLKDIEVKCEFFKNGTSVLVENGLVDPSKTIDRVSFEYKGAANKNDVINAVVSVRCAQSLTVGLVGRVFYNEECDGVIAGEGGGGTDYQAGEGININGDVISIDNSVVQHKLIAGDNITINNVTNTISADVSGKADKVDGATDGHLAGLDSTGNLTDSGIAASDVATQSDLSGKQDTLTTGPNIDIINNVISTEKTVVAAGQNVSVTSSLDSLTRTVTYTVNASGAAAQIQSDWTQTDDQSVDYIKNKPQNLVQDPDYVHTDNNFTDADKNKLDGIESGAEANVQANWNETNSSSDAYIQNKPDLSQYATTTDLSGKADKVVGATNGNLAGLDSSGNLTDSGIAASDVATQSDLSGKQDTLTPGSNVTITNNVISATDTNTHRPIQLGGSQILGDNVDPLNFVAGSNVTITNSNGSLTIAASGGTFTQEQSDWTQSDNTQVDYIKHKPNTKPVVAGSNITITEGANDITIAATVTPQVQSNWNETDTAAASFIQNKPTIPTVPTMKELVAGNGITLTEGVSDVTVACSVTVGTVVV